MQKTLLGQTESAIKTLERNAEELRGKKKITCEHCKKKREVKTLAYIQTQFYVTPRGCTEGDYWKNGEGIFVCSACGKENRLFGPRGKYHTSSKARLDVEALKPYFKTIKRRANHSNGHYEELDD